MSEANGVLPGTLDSELLGVLTEGYQPSLPGWSLFLGDGSFLPQVYLLREIEIMMIHPVVRNALRCYKSGVTGAQFEGPKGMDGQAKPVSQNPAVADFVVSQCNRFWDRGVPKVQNGYEYGWIGCENLYGMVQGGPLDGLMEWEGCLDFCPRDCFLLTQKKRPVGLRVVNVHANDTRGGLSAQRDLWFSEGAVPAKALWYTHWPRYNRFYGQSQLLGAWKPWRRLAWKDAAETVLDGGFYRAGFGGPLIKYPEEDLQAQPGSVNTTLDPDGNPIRFSRDMARMISQWLKAGSGVGIPSSQYPSDMGGGPKWTVEWQDTKFTGEPLLAYIDYLIRQVREGVGVPNELIEAAETGSGYSGRAIPLEGFLQEQQQLANAMLEMFVRQVVRPLVLWNRDFFLQYGPIDFEVRVANLLETKLKAAMNPGGAEPGMRAGEQGAGQEQGGGQVTGQDGVTWSKFQGEGGQPGWKSSGGLVRMTQTPPGALAGGMSLNYDAVGTIAKLILQKVAA